MHHGWTRLSQRYTFPALTFVCDISADAATGHFDLIVGSRARHEVWDKVLHFLAQNDHVEPSRFLVGLPVEQPALTMMQQGV